MRNCDIKNMVRRALRMEYGFSPRPSDIRVLGTDTRRMKFGERYEEDVVTVGVEVSELVERQGTHRIVAPKRYYRIFHDQIERCHEDGTPWMGRYIYEQ